MEASWWTRPDQLDDEQKDVVALAIDGSHLVVGPPGSGKTNLLLLRAAYLQARGRNNFVVLTFGRVLKEFLVNGTDAANVDAARIKTYSAWAGEILRENGVDVPDQGNFDELRKALLAGLSTLSDDVIEDYRLDYILLDECQDYTVEELRQVMRFSEFIFAAGDKNQRIYQANGVLDLLEGECDTTNTLTYHYRNGLKVCRLADGIRSLVGDRRGLEASSQYDEVAAPSEVTPHPSEPLEAQIERALPIIADQLRAYPTSIIGVLCPLKRDLRTVWEAMSRSYLGGQVQLQMFESGYAALDPDRRILVGTVHGAKGLEFRAMHILATEGIGRFPRNRNRIAYTAVTRAKTSLGIYRSSGLIGPLENGLAALHAPAARVELDSLFKS